ncbi:nitrogen fixation protein NifQ [Roseateles saccharophilus]|uniref:Nitrogen fixation protein NifQ n=1 Tax=Roseateles saccharophilus TaxID=304 RepID=A0A4R3VGR7_ROSSA|nr:nitrogen fixation protein NifQ [Roseateles saccharophilus]MDG0832063.1 nitrogen fixation protein NifQ [Roseateles saccharophilus]TCV03471.1 nitrogen fixation protein NifQ [Roseateles saccharophilus]
MDDRPTDPSLLQVRRELPAPTPLALQRRARRDDEVDDVRELLLAHAEPDPPGMPAGLARAVAEVIALACLGDNHLWQDLQLASRAELTALIERHFPRLAARNQQNMKWKKFLYKQLCEREEISICKSPSCAVCTDHAQCFGPELS